MFKSPQRCNGTTMFNKHCEHAGNCERFTKTGMLTEIKADNCIKSGYLFQVEHNSRAGSVFRELIRLYRMEQNPFTVNDQRPGKPYTDDKLECKFCVEQDRQHSVSKQPTPVQPQFKDEVLAGWLPSNSGYIRKCSGCGRWDGPFIESLYPEM